MDRRGFDSAPGHHASPFGPRVAQPHWLRRSGAKAGRRQLRELWFCKPFKPGKRLGDVVDIAERLAHIERSGAKRLAPLRNSAHFPQASPQRLVDNLAELRPAFTRKGQSEHDFSCWRAPRLSPDSCLRRELMRSPYEQLHIRFDTHQNFPGDDFGVSKIKVEQACLNKLQYLVVRRFGAFAILEYHHSDTDAFAPIQYIIRSESMRFPQDPTDAAFGAAGSIRNRTNLGVLSNEHVHKVTHASQRVGRIARS